MESLDWTSETIHALGDIGVFFLQFTIFTIDILISRILPILHFFIEF